MVPISHDVLLVVMRCSAYRRKAFSTSSPESDSRNFCSQIRFFHWLYCEASGVGQKIESKVEREVAPNRYIQD
jgi:hypothetical protein